MSLFICIILTLHYFCYRGWIELPDVFDLKMRNWGISKQRAVIGRETADVLVFELERSGLRRVYIHSAGWWTKRFIHAVFLVQIANNKI